MFTCRNSFNYNYSIQIVTYTTESYILCALYRVVHYRCYRLIFLKLKEISNDCLISKQASCARFKQSLKNKNFIFRSVSKILVSNVFSIITTTLYIINVWLDYRYLL